MACDALQVLWDRSHPSFSHIHAVAWLTLSYVTIFDTISPPFRYIPYPPHPIPFSISISSYLCANDPSSIPIQALSPCFPSLYCQLLPGFLCVNSIYFHPLQTITVCPSYCNPPTADTIITQSFDVTLSLMNIFFLSPFFIPSR